MNDKNTELYITKIRIIRGRQITKDFEEFKDANGETFIGYRGNGKVGDEFGNTFVKDNHSFIYEYSPLNEKAFGIAFDRKKRIKRLRKLAESGGYNERRQKAKK